MTIKKTFVTTSSFILTAILLSQFYSFKNQSSQSQSINYSAFTNLTQNIKSISTESSVASTASEDTIITNDIIKVIDKEITKTISRTRYSTRNIKAPHKETKKIISNTEIKKEIQAVTVVAKLESENLSSYEINNEGLINLYALSIEEMAFTKFESIKLASDYKDEIKDEVAVNQASTSLAPIEADEVNSSQAAERRTDATEAPRE